MSITDDVLYIIGNGFDLHHGVQSSYSSFCEWLKKHDRQTLSIYETVCDYDALWSDFETSMAYVNRNYFLSTGEAFLPDSKSDPEDWTMADIMLGGDWTRSVADELLDKLRKDFHKWICSINVPYNYKKRMLFVDDYARFLTFNYTTYLESHYGIPSNHVMHIHGVKTQPWGRLVVGHAEDNDKIFNKWWKAQGYDRPHYNKKGKKFYKRDTVYRMYHGDTQYLPEYEAITDSVESYYYDSQKPVAQIINSNCSYFSSLHDIRTIYVWGFSFSKVDKPYIHKIIEVNDKPSEMQWFVSTFSEADEVKALDTLLDLGIPKSSIHFKPMSDFLIAK